MYEVIVLFVLGLIWIVFATFQDLKTREIANWLNFSLIIFAIGFRFFYSLFSEGGFGFFYQGLIGLGIFIVLGNALYYGRMFAGGDAKLMIALGVILPFYSNFAENIKIFILFFILFLIGGALYGFVMSMILSFQNFKKFRTKLRKQFKLHKKLIYFIMILGLILMIFGLFQLSFFIFGVLIFIFPYFYIYAKAVDEHSMIQKLKASNLREGDWLYKEVKLGKKVLKPSWDGLTKEEIKEIKKKYSNIWIKQGIPFSPAFLIGFLILGLLFFINLIEILWNSFW